MGGGNVALNILFVSVPHTAKIAMGARAEAGVFLKLPVFQIMAGFKARLCEIGDLVLDIAVLLQKLHRLKVHIRLLLVSREASTVPHSIEGRPLLHLQPIAAQVFRGQCHGGGQIFHPVLRRLVGQAVNKVERHIFDFCPSGSLHRLLYLLHGMHSTDGAQLFIAGGLHPKGYAVESAAPQGVQSLPVPGGVWVRLKGDFRISGNMIALLHRFQNFAQPLFPKIAGCPAAKINRIDPCGRPRWAPASVKWAHSASV